MASKSTLYTLYSLSNALTRSGIAQTTAHQQNAISVPLMLMFLKLLFLCYFTFIISCYISVQLLRRLALREAGDDDEYVPPPERAFVDKLQCELMLCRAARASLDTLGVPYWGH